MYWKPTRMMHKRVRLTSKTGTVVEGILKQVTQDTYVVETANGVAHMTDEFLGSIEQLEK